MANTKNEDKQTAAADTEPTVNTDTAAAPADNRVEIYIPRGNAGDDPNLQVGVNGVNYLLPRGQTSKVPKFVADEVRRSWKAQETMDRKIDQLLEEAQKQAK